MMKMKTLLLSLVMFIPALNTWALNCPANSAFELRRPSDNEPLGCITNEGVLQISSMTLSGDWTIKNGVIGYETATDSMTFSLNSVLFMSLVDGMMILNQQGEDDQILELQSSDVSHNLTVSFNPNTYATFRKVSNNIGGMTIHAVNEGGGGNDRALILVGLSATTNPTDIEPLVVARCGKHNGSGGITAIADGETCFGVDNNAGGNLLVVEGDGDTIIAGQAIIKGSATIQSGATIEGSGNALTVKTTSDIGGLRVVSTGGRAEVEIESILNNDSFLTLKDASGVLGFLKGDRNATDGTNLFLTPNIAGAVLSLGASNQVRVVTILGNGFVGIGDTSPTEELDVVGDIRAQTRFRVGTTANSGNATNPAITDGGGTTSRGVYFKSAGVGLGSGGATKLVFLNTTGNLGVNTETPQSTLDVLGDAQFGSGVLVSSFAAVPGGSTFALSLSSGITLGNGGCIDFDGQPQCGPAGSGSGDVVAAGDNSFSGENSFSSTTTFTGVTKSLDQMISSVTLSADAIVSLDILPGHYYRMRVAAFRGTGVNTRIAIRFNNSSTANRYEWHTEVRNSSGGSGAASSTTSGQIQPLIDNVTQGFDGMFMTFEFHTIPGQDDQVLIDYRGTTSAGAALRHNRGGGWYDGDGTDVTSIQVLAHDGSSDTGTLTGSIVLQQLHNF